MANDVGHVGDAVSFSLSLSLSVSLSHINDVGDVGAAVSFSLSLSLSLSVRTWHHGVGRRWRTTAEAVAWGGAF